MKKVVGINFIKSKSNVSWVVLHLLDDSFVDTVNHLDLFSSDFKSAWGQSVSTEFIPQEDLKYGNVEIIGGDLKPGAYVRILKENVNGMDKVSIIQIVNKPDVNSFINPDNDHGLDAGKGAAKAQVKK